MQAQLPPAAALAFRARDGHGTESSVLADRELVRTWAMRGTLHLLAIDDARWIVPLLESLRPPPVARWRTLGVDPDRAAPRVAAALAGGPLPRAALGEALGLGGQALIHTLRAAARAGVCVYDEGETFVLAEDRLGTWERREPEGALAELARRYRAAYAPAELADFAAWSGLPARAARTGWVGAGGDGDGAADRRHCAAAPRGLRLLGAYDPYLLGWRRRDHAVAAEHARRVHPGGGVVRPVVLDRGRAVATWNGERRGDVLHVTVEPFGDPVDVAEEADAVARFRGLARARVSA